MVVVRVVIGCAWGGKKRLTLVVCSLTHELSFFKPNSIHHHPLTQHLVLAPRTVAHHPALGRRAVVGLAALPPALGRLAPGRAVGLGRAALDAALGWVALDAAQVAVAAQALGVVRAHVAALGRVALDDALDRKSVV